MFDISNELGEIRFSKNVIYKICADAVTACDGTARIQNYRGRVNPKKPALLAESFSQTVDEIDDNDLELHVSGRDVAITVYIVTRFGTSISASAEMIIDHIYREMEAVFGFPPVRVTVIVTGIASRTIAERHIEFSR